MAQNMPSPVLQLLRDSLSGENRRAMIVLLTSSACLAGWHLIGNYAYWQASFSAGERTAGDVPTLAAIASLSASAILLGMAPLLVARLALRDALADYGLRLGNWRFAVVCSVLAAPLLVAIGYFSAQSPEFQQVYPLNPPARHSNAALLWHLAGQVVWYAAWEFHFRGFLQHGLGKSFGAPLGILVQTLASTLAHFGKPGSEVFASILAGLLWGALAWRSRSLLAGIFQHWLLGAALDVFIARG